MPSIAPKPNAQMVQIRTEGIKLLSPLQTAASQLEVVDQDSYLEADFMLARIKAARTTWRTKIDPILRPLKAAIDAAKDAMAGAKSLDAEVDGPLVQAEGTIKGKMQAYKIEEARQQRALDAAAETEAQRLRDEAAKKATAAAAAKTPQMRAKLEQARAEAEAAAQQVEAEAQMASQEAVKGAASSVRTQKKVRIANPLAFVAAMASYAPRAGLYTMGTPPLTLLTHKIHKLKVGGGTELVEDGSALEALTTELTKIYAQQPGVVKSWPGVEEWDDITIANR